MASSAGKASHTTFFLSSLLSIVFIGALVTGHLVLGFWAWFHFTEQMGMKIIAGFTGLPSAILWASVCVSFILDIWILINTRKTHEKLKKR